MEYKVITVSDYGLRIAREELEKTVNELLKQGWKLQGGISLQIREAVYGTQYMFAQAMVYEKDETSPKSEFHVSVL